MKKYILILAIAVMMLEGCGDCDLVTATYPCRVREATITQFDPRLNVINDSTVVPVPTYSIHTFSFPNDNESSGLLTNDTRFDQDDPLKEVVVLAEEEYTFRGRDYRAQLVSRFPTNEAIVGDVMVVDVTSSAPRTALLRFYGYLSQFPMSIQSEDAALFCDTLEAYRVDNDGYDGVQDASSRFGQTLPQAELVELDQDDLRVIDEDGRDVTNTELTNIPPETRENLLSSSASNAYDIRVTPGEIYYYRARNGKEFSMLIADINQGSFDPFLKRVTLKFSEISEAGKKGCE
jgi:hypothetical protein